jgi:hypothetical protein
MSSEISEREDKGKKRRKSSIADHFIAEAPRLVCQKQDRVDFDDIQSSVTTKVFRSGFNISREHCSICDFGELCSMNLIV